MSTPDSDPENRPDRLDPTIIMLRPELPTPDPEHSARMLAAALAEPLPQRPRGRRRALWVGAAAVFALGGVTGAVAADRFGSTPDGRTFGGLPVDPRSPEPDLVGVVGDSGRAGYAVRSELFGEDALAESPAEAVAQQRERCARYRDGEQVDRVVPVYDEDGRTQIDTFSVMIPADACASEASTDD